MKKILLGLAVAGLLSVNASATLISDTYSTGALSAGTDITATLNQFLSVAGLPALNPGEVYVLNWWQLTVDTQGVSEVAQGENTSPGNGAALSANVAVGALFNGTDTGNPSAPANGSFGANTLLVFGPFAASAFDGLLDFGGPSGVTFTPPPQNTAVDSDSSAMIFDLTGVNGVGTFQVFIDATDTSAFFGGGGVASLLTTSQLTNVTVTYDFDVQCVDQQLCNPTGEVPEPSTMAMMGLGLVGLGFIGRRLRK